MTAILDRPLDTEAWTIGAPRLLAGLHATSRLDLAGHLAVHGPLPATDRDRTLAHLDAARLTGRGGAGFPLATKLRSLPDGAAKHVVVNGAESEPASRKDRVLLRRAPHLVLDGALAIGARELTVAVHDEQTAASVRAAIGERPDARHVRVRVVGGGFVAGEARAVVRALAEKSAGPALPPGRRTPPTTTGTLVSNAETFAQFAVLLRLGPRRFADTGTLAEPGSTLLTVGGAVTRPGVVEIPTGTPLGIVLSAAGAPADPQAVVLGGYHGAWLRPLPTIRLSREGAAAAGGTLGAGVLLVLDHATCALGELARVAQWLAGQSARQCGPCRFGLPALAADVAALAAGHPTVGAAFAHGRTILGRGACAHPDGAVRFVTSGLHLLQDEVDRHLSPGGCGRPVLNRVGAP